MNDLSINDVIESIERDLERRLSRDKNKKKEFSLDVEEIDIELSVEITDSPSSISNAKVVVCDRKYGNAESIHKIKIKLRTSSPRAPSTNINISSGRIADEWEKVK